MPNIIFIHGLESSGDGFKGKLLRKALPGCLTPSFTPFSPRVSTKELLEKRMKQLYIMIKEKTSWIIIGSSFGALMATLFTLNNPEKVSKLILLAPYLSIPELDPKNYSPVNIPVIVFHGKHDKTALVRPSQARAEKLFTNLVYNIVDDDHSLQKTVQALDWKKIIKKK